MTPVSGRIALSAKSELVETWEALLNSKAYGSSLLELKCNLVMTRIFGEALPVEEQEDLDLRVVDYCGKCVALELINPGIDYWSKQVLSLTATGRSEAKAYKDRANDLQKLREYLLAQIKGILPDIIDLLPDRTVGIYSSVPRVTEVGIGHTSDPYQFERAFEEPEETALG
jgi:hypothetical protein